MSEQMTKIDVADETRRFLNRRRRAHAQSVGNFKRALAEDAVDAMVHSREALVEGVRLGVLDEALRYYEEAASFASVSVGERKLTDEEDQRATVAGFDQMYAATRARFIRLARDLGGERDAHRLVVLSARVAALAEIVETIEDQINSMPPAER